MDNDEKKFKLDELPDEGSSSIQSAPPPRPKKKSSQEPRIVSIKKLTDAEKMDVLSVTWRFDKLKMKWGWLVAIICLLILEKKQLIWPSHPRRLAIVDELLGFDTFIYNLSFIADHSLLFIFLIPFIFKFQDTEGLFFELNFNGISSVRDISTYSAGAKRVFIPWDEIKKVKKISVAKREVLEIHSAKGPEAHLIWDIDEIKKKVIKQILAGLVNNKHPMRIFIEKEVT